MQKTLVLLAWASSAQAATLTPSTDVAQPGDTVVLTLTDAPAGATAYLGVAPSPGTLCPPSLGGACLGLSTRAQLVAQVTTSSTGEASVSVRLPRSAQPGDVYLQAAVVGANVTLSDVVPMTVAACPTWYGDGDGDGFGHPGVTRQRCTQPAGYVAVGTDCDDTDAAISPADPTTCNAPGWQSDPTAVLRCDGYDAAAYPEVPARFEVVGTRAVMYGVINGGTPARFEALLADHPYVDTLVMPFVPGSMDDVANLAVSRELFASGLDTCVPTTGVIASGGVDFFLAGDRRSARPGALLGVHSWGAGPIAGSALPMSHPAHDLYLDYYAEIGVDAAFYWYTLAAAGPNDVHWMTRAELRTYDVER
jgi:hypothetical protein